MNVDRLHLHLHLYSQEHLGRVVRLLSPVIERSASVLVTIPASVVDELRGEVNRVLPAAHVLEAEAALLDWSGYLRAFSEVEASPLLVFCNDSVVTRRHTTRWSIRRFLTRCDEAPSRSLIGELDVSSESVCLDGRSSTAWISSYLFGTKGWLPDPARLVLELDAEVERQLAEESSLFMAHLRAHRPSYLSDPQALHSKVATMVLERRMTELASQDCVTITNAFGGSMVRKFERLAESLVA